MATTDKQFKKKKIFQIVRELNVSKDRVVEFLEEKGYADALSGSGLNAKITDEEAYLVLREEYADDAEAAARIRELRNEREGAAGGDGQPEAEAPAPSEAERRPAPQAEEQAEEQGEEEPSAADDVAPDAEAAEASSEEDAEADTQIRAEDAEATSVDASTDEAAAVEEKAEAATGDTRPEAAAEESEATPPPEAQAEERTSAEDDVSEPAEPAPAEAEAVEDVAETEETVSAESEPAEEPAPVSEKAPKKAPEEAADEEHAKARTEEPAADGPEAPTEGESAEEAPPADEGPVAPEAEDEPTPVGEESVSAEEETLPATATTEDERTDEAPEPPEVEAVVEPDAVEPDDAPEGESVSEEPAPAEPVREEPTPDAESDVELAEGEAPAETEAEHANAQQAEGEGEVTDEETLKASRYRLSGTQVVGKVDLEELRRPKRKRKRKKKKKKEEEKKKKRKKKQKKKKKRKKRKKKRKKRKKKRVDEEDVEQTIQETLQELEQGASRARQRRRRRRRERHERERQKQREKKKEREGVLRVTEFVTTGELANLMGEPVKEVIGTLFEAGMMVSINQRLDRETVEFVAAEYDLEVEFIDEFSSTAIHLEKDDPDDLQPRAPVVTVMGHVDHGKTSLLDYIRNANVVAGEEGGITQHIGAHYVKLTDFDDAAISFLDTPGHEAFTAMRARGAKATDIVILVVAADDSVMPQTIEAINHAQAAEVPMVVAINKMDLPEADPQRVKAELAEHNVLVEQYGGTVQVAEVSAETGEGIDDLMEKVLLQAEIMELQANPNRQSDGVVIESRLEKGRGNVITVLVQNGTLSVGDPFVAGIYSGRVRAMFDERDQRIDDVQPAHPALVLGCNGSPEVGDQFVALEDESEARDIAQERQRIHREQELRRKSKVSLDQVSRRMAAGEFHELNLIVKADVGGSVEALSDALLKLKTDEVAVNIIHSGVGAITESDVMLARASEAVIIGFQVRPTTGARKTAEREEIDIRTYSIIYDAIEDVHDALEGLLSPEKREETEGRAEVRETFKVPGVGTVAGCYVTDGTINRNHKIRVIREGVVVYEGAIESLKRFKEDVKEVQSGYECGLGIANFNDVKVGDEFETYVVIEEKRTLEV